MGWLIAIAAVSLAAGLGFGIANSVHQDEQIKIERERLRLQREGDLTDALSSLDTIKTNFDSLKDITIPKLQSEMEATQTDIDLWDQRYAQEIGGIQAEIDTVDDLIGNWQNSYDAQTLSAKSEGQENLSTLLSNWSDAEVMAADRGMGGSMSLVAQQQKQKAIAYAGSDLSLAGDDGIYGAAYATLVSNLSSQRNQYETKRNLLSGTLELTDITLQNELDSWTKTLENQTKALSTNQKSLSDLYDRMGEQLDVIIAKDSELGNTHSAAVARAKKTLNDYKDYI